MPVHSAKDGTSDLLSRLMQLLGPSLALFVDDSGIWSRPGAEEIKLAIADLCTDLRSLFERAGTLLDAEDIPAPQVEYPIRYTALHDVNLSYLLPHVQLETRNQIATVESWGDRTGDLGDLLREVQSTLKTHLDAVDQLAAKLAAANKPAAAS
jgi:hypothetical protein